MKPNRKQVGGLRDVTMPVVQSLETRRLLSAFGAGFSQTVGGCTLSYQDPNADTSYKATLVITGTAGDDVMQVGRASDDPNKVRFTLNGQTIDFTLPELGMNWFDASPTNLILDGGAGNDRIQDDLLGG